MLNLSRYLEFGIAFILINSASLVAQSQQPAPQNPVINFVAPIDTNTVSILNSIVSAQIRGGSKKVKILISSPGGDTASAFAAYNFLRNAPIEVTTFNVGTVDSAAVILYCSGRNRYALPATRFLVHGNAFTFPASIPMDQSTLDARLQELTTLNQMIIRVVSTATNGKKQKEIKAAVRGQVILAAEEAKAWGLVQDVKDTFMEAQDVLISVNVPSETPIKKSNPSNPPLIPIAASRIQKSSPMPHR